MLYPKPPIPSPAILPKPPTPASWPWHSPVVGHMIFEIPGVSPPFDGWLGHPLLHMQLEKQFLGWVLVSSYCCSTYRVADPFSYLSAFTSSFMGGPVFHPIDDCEHPLLYLPGIGIESQESYMRVLSPKSFWHIVAPIVSVFDCCIWDGFLGGAVAG
jgi:hypothetical protein